MRVLATLSSLRARAWGAQPEKAITGAAVVGDEFPVQVARHGSFDRHLFYAPDPASQEEGEQAIPALFPAEEARRKVAVRPWGSLREDLANPGWDILLSSLGAGAGLRARFARRPFCVVYQPVGPIHDVVSRRLIPEILADLKPYDVILYTCEEHRAALQEQWHGTAERLGRALGRAVRLPVRFAKLPLGVDTATFRPRDKQEARRECRLPPEHFIVLCVGRLVVSDKMDVLPVLTGLRSLISARPALGERFLLVLRGEQSYTNYADLVRKRVAQMDLQRNVMFSADAPLPALYAAADVFLAPSDGATESFGLTPIEAMAAGTPAVVSDWDGYREEVVHGQTGFLFRTVGGECHTQISQLWPVQEYRESSLYAAQATYLDFEEMFRHLVTLHENPALLRRLGAQARARVEERFAWPRVVEQFHRICDESLREAGEDRHWARP